MHDAGYSPMNFVRKGGQMPIENIIVTGNIIQNLAGGDTAIEYTGIDGGQIALNTVIGYDRMYVVNGGSGVITETLTPTATATPTAVCPVGFSLLENQQYIIVIS